MYLLIAINQKMMRHLQGASNLLTLSLAFGDENYYFCRVTGLEPFLDFIQRLTSKILHDDSFQ